MATSSYRIKNLDHLGLVAGMCRELGLAQMVDAIVPKQGDYQVSHGEALVAMIINGLGFHSHTLHMFPQFFADKPTERLLRPGILPEHLNDDVLGRCLDALFEADMPVCHNAGCWCAANKPPNVNNRQSPKTWSKTARLSSSSSSNYAKNALPISKM